MNTLNDNILLVDDDNDLCELLQEFLRGEGFEVDYELEGGRAVDRIAEQGNYAAVVLDIMMPNVSGFDVLKSIRQTSNIPVIMLTGRGDDIDRIVGLEMGADDYLGKPCNPRELAARLRAVLRRTRNFSEPVEDNPILSHHGIVINSSTFTVTIKDELIDFTHAEFSVLLLLMQNIGQTLSKEYITKEVLHREFTAYDRSIDVHISRVRQKISKFDGLKSVIKSVRGIGYQMLKQI